MKLRCELATAGYDAGPETIAHHLIGQVDKVPSVATVWRILKRNGLITPQPHKPPKCSFIRFEAKLPNETWQLDSTPWQLADETQVEILNLLDDKSRVALDSKTFMTVKAADPVHVFLECPGGSADARLNSNCLSGTQIRRDDQLAMPEVAGPKRWADGGRSDSQAALASHWM